MLTKHTYLFLVSLTVAVAVAVLAGLPESLTTTLSVYSLVVSADKELFTIILPLVSTSKNTGALPSPVSLYDSMLNGALSWSVAMTRPITVPIGVLPSTKGENTREDITKNHWTELDGLCTHISLHEKYKFIVELLARLRYELRSAGGV